MNHYLSQADYVVWVAGLALEFLILGAGVYQKHYRRHPAFLSYIAISAVKTLVLMSLVRDYDAYYYAYWLGMIVKSGFLGWLVWEIFRDVFKTFASLPTATRQSLTIMFSAATLAILAINVLSHSEFFTTLNRTMNLCALALTWIVIFQSDLLHIPKTQNMYGICSGIFFSFLLDAVVGGLKQTAMLRTISMGGFVVAESVWFRYMLIPPPAVDVCAKKKVAWVMANLHTQAIAIVSRKIS